MKIGEGVVMDLKRFSSLCSAAIKRLNTADACWESLSHPQLHHLRFAPRRVFFIIYPYLKSFCIPKRLFPLQPDSFTLSIAAPRPFFPAFSSMENRIFPFQVFLTSADKGALQTSAHHESVTETMAPTLPSVPVKLANLVSCLDPR